MREEFEKAMSHGRSAWRFRYVALMTAWIVAILGWFVVFLIPNQYETTARVFVDANSLLRPLLEGIAVTPTASNQQADFVRRALLSRAQLERVIDTTELKDRIRSTVDRENLLKDLATHIRITANASGPGGDREANIFSIAYADSDPELAFTVVNQLLETFVSQSVGANRTDANTAQRFLQEQIGDYERRLSESESRLADFKKKNIGSMPDERGGYFQRLQTDMTQLDNLSSNLAVVTRKRDDLRAKLLGGAGSDNAGQLGAAMTETSVDARIRDAHVRLEDMLLRFTDRHPDVAALRQTIDRLEEQRQAELSSLRNNVGALGVSRSGDSLVVQNLQISLNQAEIEVTSLQAQVADYRQRVDTLRSHINTLPEVEAQLADLNRDYNVTRTEYERLLQRLESAKLSDAVDRVDEVRFKVIDPPIEELLPVKPKRALMVAGVALASIGSGVLLAFLLSQLWPVYVFSRELIKAYEIPVLGVVSVATGTRLSRLRSRFAATTIVGMTACLVGIAVALILFRSHVEAYSARLW